MSLTKTPPSMIDTTGATAGQVLTYNGSTSTWVASAAPTGTGSFASKAWVNFNGVQSTGIIPASAIMGSYNISSVTRNSAGDYTINFTAPLTDANYAVSSMVASNTLYVNQACVIAATTGTTPATKTQSALRILTGNGGNGAVNDNANVSVIIFGN